MSVRQKDVLWYSLWVSEGGSKTKRPTLSSGGRCPPSCPRRSASSRAIGTYICPSRIPRPPTMWPASVLTPRGSPLQHTLLTQACVASIAPTAGQCLAPSVNTRVWHCPPVRAGPSFVCGNWCEALCKALAYVLRSAWKVEAWTSARYLDTFQAPHRISICLSISIGNEGLSMSRFCGHQTSSASGGKLTARHRSTCWLISTLLLPAKLSAHIGLRPVASHSFVSQSSPRATCQQTVPPEILEDLSERDVSRWQWTRRSAPCTMSHQRSARLP